jgi:NADH-quinone oxidoreductase subunit L
VLAFAGGVGAAYYVYVVKRGEPAARFTEAAPGVHRFAENKFEVDEFYEETVIGSVDALGDVSVVLDKWMCDGLLARFTAFVVGAFGGILRFLQNGRVQAYSLSMVFGVALLGWFILAPRAETRTKVDPEKGIYSVAAAPGLGYSYRWDANGDDQWDSKDFGKASEVSVTLEPDQKRLVRVEVKNAFGRTAMHEVALERPKIDLSGAPPEPMPDVEKVQRQVDEVMKRGVEGVLQAPAAPSGGAP